MGKVTCRGDSGVSLPVGSGAGPSRRILLWDPSGISGCQSCLSGLRKGKNHLHYFQVGNELESREPEESLTGQEPQLPSDKLV